MELETMGRPSWQATLIGCLVFLLIGLGSGYGIGHWWETSDLKTALALEKAKPPLIKETVKTVTDTKLQYVPGETVYVPVPGKPEALPEPKKLDGKFQIGKPEFVYTLNGKPGVFTKTDDERYVLDKNMITLQQSSTVSIDVRTYEQPRAKIGGYAQLSQDLEMDVGVIAAYQSRRFDVELKFSKDKQGKIQSNIWF